MSAFAKYLDACARIVHPDTDEDARDVASGEADSQWRRLTKEERASVSTFAFALRAEEQADHRAALVRAILAEQWVAAIALYNPRGNNKGVTVDHVDHKDFAGEWMGLAAEDLAALPCAVDVVAERMGER